MKEMEERVKQIGKNLDVVNDTLFICHYASKHGLQYKKILKDNNNFRRYSSG